MLAKIFDLIHFFICDILGTYPILGLTNSLIYFHLLILDLLIPFSWLIGLTIINGEFWSIFLTVMAMLHLFIYLHYAIFKRYLFAYLMSIISGYHDCIIIIPTIFRSRRHFSFGKLPVECGEQPALDGIDILVSV